MALEIMGTIDEKRACYGCKLRGHERTLRENSLNKSSWTPIYAFLHEATGIVR